MRLQRLSILIILILITTGVSMSQDIYDYHGNLPVKVDGKYGLIDQKGKIVLQPQFDALFPLNEWDHFKIQQGNKYGAIDTNFYVLIPTEWDEVNTIHHNYALTRNNSNFYVYKTEGRSALPIGDSVAAVKVLDTDLFAVKTSGYWKIVNFSGELIVNDSLDNVKILFDRLNIEKNGKFGLCSKNGKEVLPIQYSEIREVNGLAIVFRYNNKWGIADTSGTILTKAVWNDYTRLGNCIRVKGDNKTGLYSVKERKMIIQPGSYNDFIYLNSDYYVSVNGSLVGLISKDGVQLTPAKYDRITYMDDYFRVYKDGNYGIIDLNGKEIIPCKHFMVSKEGSFYLGKSETNIDIYTISGNNIYSGFLDEVVCNDNSVKIYLDSTASIYLVNEAGEVTEQQKFNNVSRITIRKGYRNVDNIFNRPSAGMVFTVDGISDLSNDDNDPWFFVDSVKKWGLMAPNDTVLIKPAFAKKYRNVLNDSLTIVQRHRKLNRIQHNNYGVINEHTGRIIIPIKITDIWFNDLNTQNYAICFLSNLEIALLMKDGKLKRNKYVFVDNESDWPRRFNVGGKLKEGTYFSNLNPSSYYRGLKNGVDYGKWGYLDENGNVLIPAEYINAEPFKHGVAIVTGTEGKGLISKDSVLIPLTYTDVYRAKNSGDSLLYLKTVNRNYGIATTSGNFVTDCEYPFMDDIHEGLIRFKNGSRYGYMDTEGNVVIEPIYRKAENYSDGLAAVAELGRYGFIDAKGNEIIEPSYKKVGAFKSGIAWVKHRSSYIYIDQSGEQVGDQKFTICYDFKGNYARFNIRGKLGMIDVNGNIAIEPKYLKLEDFNKDGLAKFTHKGKTGYLDTTGNVIIPAKYRHLGQFYDGLAKYSKISSYGYLNTNNDVVIKPRYDGAGDFSEGFAAVKIGRYWGYIDTTGTLKLHTTYKYAGSFKNGVAVVQLDDYGVINKNGDEIIPNVYDYITIFHDTLFFCRLDKDIDVYNHMGRKLMTLEGIKDVVNVIGDLLIVKEGYSKYSARDIYGNEVFKPNFKALKFIGKNLIKYRLMYNFGVADVKGNIIEEPIYESIEYMGNFIFKVSKGDRFGYIRKNSEWLWKPTN